jgi:hypothetical protein
LAGNVSELRAEEDEISERKHRNEVGGLQRRDFEWRNRKSTKKGRPSVKRKKRKKKREWMEGKP